MCQRISPPAQTSHESPPLLWGEGSSSFTHISVRMQWWARGWVGFEGPQPSAEACPHSGALQVPVPRDKQKKKKKEQKPCELHSDPPIRRTLGTGRVTLESLLATEDLVATVCDFGILITQQPLQPPSLEEKVRSVSRGRAVRQGCCGRAGVQVGVQHVLPCSWSRHPSHPSLSSPLRKMGLK